MDGMGRGGWDGRCWIDVWLKRLEEEVEGVDEEKGNVS